MNNLELNQYILHYIKDNYTKVQSCSLPVGERGKATISRMI